MTRKDYVLLARHIHDQGSCFRTNKAHAEFALATAAILADDNPHFDAERFITACTPNWVVGTTEQKHWDRALITVRTMAS